MRPNKYLMDKLSEIYCNHYKVNYIEFGKIEVRSLDGRRIFRVKVGRKGINKLYAKFKLEAKVGRVLGRDETVDHIDEDITNDNFSNLQLLSRVDNARKSAKYATTKKYPCVWCGKKFTITKEQRNSRSKGKSGPFCSRQCSGKYGAAVQNGEKKIKRTSIKIRYKKRGMSL